MNQLKFISYACIVGVALILSPSAFGQDRELMRRCLALTSVEERVDCLESGSTNRQDPAPPAKLPQTQSVAPSFDCQAATHTIERAICGDPTLSDWDARMGRQYQAARRLRKPSDAQAILESQRSWILQRNAVCGAASANTVWSCVLQMTKQRIAALSELPQSNEPDTRTQVDARPSPDVRPSVETRAPLDVRPSLDTRPKQLSTPKETNAPQPIQLPTTSTKPLTTTNTEPDGPNILLVMLFIVGGLIGAITVFNNIKRREELRRLEAERQRLIAKYGDEIAQRILSHHIWQGMTDEQLTESWGSPADKDQEIKHTKTKETWKYGQTGRNRFSSRVFIENGTVIGWKQ